VLQTSAESEILQSAVLKFVNGAANLDFAIPNAGLRDEERREPPSRARPPRHDLKAYCSFLAIGLHLQRSFFAGRFRDRARSHFFQKSR